MADVFKVTIDSLLLDRTDSVLDAHGLSGEQIDILNILISYFRKNNMEVNNSSDVNGMIKYYLEDSDSDRME